MGKNTADGFSDPAFLILMSLSNGAKHGYAIIEDVAVFAGVTLGPGTLYGAIARLEQRGWIEPLPADDRRLPYRLTAEGDAVLRKQLDRLGRFALLGLQRLGMSNG